MYPQQFGNQWQSPFTGYTPQFQQQQQYQPTMAQNMASQGITGRLVASLDEIAPNEVPMNGSTAFFPVSDGSAIFAKSWNRDGSISTAIYRPANDEVPEDVTEFTLADVIDQLNDIQDMLKAAKKPAPKRTPAKKEAEDDSSE